jgi:hypothetical protein
VIIIKKKYKRFFCEKQIKKGAVKKIWFVEHELRLPEEETVKDAACFTN